METIDIASLPISNGDWVLDLGCGEGRHSIACSFHFPSANVVGIDLDLTSITAAKKKHIEFHQNLKNANYLNGSGFCLPFADHCFDHIICSEVLEHINEYELFLHEITRILKPGGTFTLSVPRAWPEKLCWLFSSEYHQVEGGHVRIFNSKQLRAEVTNYNFRFLSKHWAHALHTPYWWLRCLWWRNGEENPISRVYHKILVWDLLKRPWITQKLERLLNPIVGKSIVYYFKKEL